MQLLNERYTEGNRVPIIITSGHADRDDVITLFRNGAADFLPKPIHYEHLVQQLQRFFPTLQVR
ncbi:MAG: response regulator [Gammaproteobacteria bacterium]|nr:response regulator [Gammaproteobacteria bacterium]